MVGILDSYTVAQYGNLHIRHFDKEGDDENCAGGGSHLFFGKMSKYFYIAFYITFLYSTAVAVI